MDLDVFMAVGLKGMMMKLTSLALVKKTLLFFICFLSWGFVLCDTWPNKPVRLIVPIGSGSAPDVVARLLGERLGILWGQAVVVDNRPGAGGIPGMSTLVRRLGMVTHWALCLRPLERSPHWFLRIRSSTQMLIWLLSQPSGRVL